MLPPRSATRLLTSTTLLGALAFAPGCFFLGGTAGSGVEASEPRTVETFTEIEVGGDYELVVQIGPTQSLTVTADDNILPLIETRVVNGTLEIDTSESVRAKVAPVITVTAPSIVGIDASGATKVRASGLTGQRFEIDTSGASTILLSGDVSEFDVDVSGASNIDAIKLQAKTVKVDVSGAAKVEVTASESLDVNVSGAGKVTYGGSPKVSENVSGAGKVVRR